MLWPFRKNEHTSPKIASVASRLMRMSDDEVIQYIVDHPGAVQKVAASALTQAPDKVRAEATERV